MLDLSIMGLLLRTDLLANDRSAVTRVIEILKSPKHTGPKIFSETSVGHVCRTAVSLAPQFDSPSFKSVFEEVEKGFLHHVCHLTG